MLCRAVARSVSVLASVNMRSYTFQQNEGSAREMARVLSGKELAAALNTELRHEVGEWVASGRRAPALCCILVGGDPASHTYVRNKIKAAEEIGITARLRQLDESISQTELCQIIESYNSDAQVDGVLVQLPLPAGLNERVVCSAVARRKDVDGFHEANVGRLTLDLPALVPATPLAVLQILRRNGIETAGRHAVVVGRSKNVGLPLALLLHSDGAHASGLGQDATVTICHRYTPPALLKAQCLSADIIVSATGVPHLITGDMVKPGATVIDVGITRVVDDAGRARLRGDVHFDQVSRVAGALTPVPGGVGPVTVAMLMRNTLQAARDLAPAAPAPPAAL